MILRIRKVCLHAIAGKYDVSFIGMNTFSRIRCHGEGGSGERLHSGRFQKNAQARPKKALFFERTGVRVRQITEEE